MRVTLHDLIEFKRRGEKFAMITAYDYTSAQLVDRAGLPAILIGDSLGMVVQGHENTIPVSLDEVVYHCRLVARGAKRALLVGDLPFMTYYDEGEALRSAARLIREGGCQAVKLEGGGDMIPVVAALSRHGLPVMGHLGYTPQSTHVMGRQVVRGKTVDQAHELLADARRLESAGAFAIVLECVPAPLATMITASVGVPTIGIGSGPGCDGQVQVFHDLLGLYTDYVPRHIKQYANLAETIESALGNYAAEVGAGLFPTERHAPSMPEATLRAMMKEVEDSRSA